MSTDKSIPLPVLHLFSLSWQIVPLKILTSYIFYFGFKRVPSKSEFWDIQVLWQKFPKFLLSFLKAKVSFLSNFASIFSAIKHNSPYLFRSSIIYFGQRQPISANFWDFWLLESKFVKLLMSVLNREVSSFSIFALFFILMTQYYPENLKPMHFSTLDERIPSKSKFWDFQVSGKNFPNFSCHFWKQKSVFHFASIFSATKRKSLVLFQVKHNIFGQRQSIKVQIFEIFEYLNQTFSNCSCQFWTEKSVTFQFLHNS